jgi:hypothetical protein
MAKITTFEGNNEPKTENFFQKIIKNDAVVLGLAIFAVYVLKKGKK